MGLIGKSVGNYRVLAKVGEGGMGMVYLGEHPLIGKRVAIKVLHEELATKEDIVSRFFVEARAVNEIGHPNIVDVVDYGRMKDDETGADIVYFVMEFLDGEGLNTRLKREGVSIKEALNIADQCASALGASHAKHIVHRDLKPENIYLVHRGDVRNYVKLLDFGIAKLTGGDAQGMAGGHKTRTGLVMGTPSYMSPEQCDGKGNIDWRSDIYSLGIVMYEMLTGRVPFPGDGFGEVLVAQLTKQPELPSSIRQDIPPAIDLIVMHLIEKKKDRRFQSMDEVRAAIADPDAHARTYTPSAGGTGQTVLPTPAPQTGAATMLLSDAPHLAPPAPMGGQATMMLPEGAGIGAAGPLGAGGPRPTTLTGSSGEVSAEPARSSRAPLFVVVGLLVGGAGLGGFFFLQHQSKVKQEAAMEAKVKAAEAAAQPVDDTVKVSIETRPAGATVFRAGHKESIGKTPFELDVHRAEPDFDVVLKLDGYKDEVKSVSTQRDHDMLIALSKVAVAAAAEPAVEKKPSSSSSSSSSHHSSSSSSSGKKPKKGGGDVDGTLEPTF